LLCIEPSFPGRLGAVADWLVRRRGYQCQFLFNRAEPRESWPESAGRGIDLVPFNVGGVAREPAVAWNRCLERGLCYAYGAWETFGKVGPVDVVLGRSAGLGSTLFVPVGLPRVPFVNLFEYFPQAHAHDLVEDVSPAPAEYFHWRQTAATMDLLDLENGLTAWAPSAWQRDLFPAEYRDDFLVLYDGVDAAQRGPRPRTLAGRTVPEGTRVVSFVARSLDRLRGFDRFVALANVLLRARPDVVCVAAGGGPVQRGLDVQYYQTDYADTVLRQTPPADPERFWLLGPVPPAAVADLLARSDVHVYPSRPYGVSRSLLEAMAAGRVVVAADTGPVREFVTHGQTGLLVPGAEPEHWAEAVRVVLDDPDGHRPLGEAAAAVVRERYARDVTLPNLAERLHRLVSLGE
jgi:glycosyltransferase involved in cell wall biosynthesis